MSGIQRKTGLAIGNVDGSNIAIVFLIIGVACLIHPLRVTSKRDTETV